MHCVKMNKGYAFIKIDSAPPKQKSGYGNETSRVDSAFLTIIVLKVLWLDTLFTSFVII